MRKIEVCQNCSKFHLGTPTYYISIDMNSHFEKYVSTTSSEEAEIFGCNLDLHVEANNSLSSIDSYVIGTVGYRPKDTYHELSVPRGCPLEFEHIVTA